MAPERRYRMDKPALKRGDLLVARVAAGAPDETSYALLNAFFSGYPIDRLRRLLLSDSDTAVRGGAWIASELGERARPLLGDLVTLLTAPTRDVRFFVLDAIVASASEADGEAVAAAVDKIRDPEQAVRWNAMNYLVRASREVLSSSVAYAKFQPLSEAVRWFLKQDAHPDIVAVTRRLQDQDQLRRLVAASAAARLRGQDPSALRFAAESPDAEVRSFAREHLDTLAGGGGATAGSAPRVP